MPSCLHAPLLLAPALALVPAAAAATDDHEAPDAAVAESEAPDDSLEAFLDERLRIGGIAAYAYQWQHASGADASGGAVTIRPELELDLSDVDLVHLTFALAGGDAVNDRGTFSSSPWGADLEADLRDVNGSGRDFIQRLWYRRVLGDPDLESGDGMLQVTVGIIDSTEYLDQNAYKNDEYVQFMNSTFVNAPVAFLPSYAPGVAVEWARGAWSANAAVMRVAENDDGNDYVYAGAQLGYRFAHGDHEDTIRLTVGYASDEFLDAAGLRTEPRLSAVLSGELGLTEHTAAFARLGWQDDAAAVNAEWMASAGLELHGTAWGRPLDTVGLGAAVLGGGNAGIEDALVLEAYARTSLTSRLFLTADVQYLDDSGPAGDVDGIVLGGRVALEF